jgi:hypothetical protein
MLSVGSLSLEARVRRLEGYPVDETRTKISRQLAFAAPADDRRTECSYFIQTDYNVRTEYNVIFGTMTTTAYVPIETVITTSITETKLRTRKKDETVVLSSTCSSY